MKPYVKLYLKHFDCDINTWIKCEIPDCNSRAVDIHHVEARGMGGTKAPENINNLIALCRSCHIKYGDKKQYMDMLKEIVANR